MTNHRHSWKGLKPNIDSGRIDKCEKCNIIRKLVKPKQWSKGYWFKGEYVKAKLINYDIWSYSINGNALKELPSCKYSNKEFEEVKKMKDNVNIFDILGGKDE